jgi:hypothetical protein
MYGKRAFQMIAKILERLADKNKLTPEEIELLSTELVQPGIDQLQVRTIIKLLNEKIRKS